MTEKLCPACQKKPPPANLYRGQCHAQACPDCKAWTTDFTLTMCDPCADFLGRCSWCLGPITGGLGADVPTTKQFCRRFADDKGSHVPGMNIGEQILVELRVDLYSPIVWMPYQTDPEISYYGYRTIRDPRDWRHGTLEFYYDLNRVAEKARIILKEDLDPKFRSWWWTPPAPKNPRTWSCTVEIRR
jgi:hypothetical protein